MVQTITTWAGNQVEPEFVAAIDAQIAIYTAEGKTDGTCTGTMGPNNRRVERNWIDVASAQAFLDFLDTLTPAAVTKEIVE